MYRLALLLGFVSSVAYAVEPPWATIIPIMKPPGQASYVIIHNGGEMPPDGYTLTWPGGQPGKPPSEHHRRLAVGMTCDWFDVDASDKTKILIQCMRNPAPIPVASSEPMGPPRGQCPPDFGPVAPREPWPSCKGK